MPARLVADMFAMSNGDRATLLRSDDKDFARFFDVAVRNIDPGALAGIVRDQAVTGGSPTVLEALLINGAAAALERLRVAYDNTPPEYRVSYAWNDDRS